MATLLRPTVRQKMVLASLLALLPLIVFAYVSLQENIARAKQQQLQGSAATAKVVAAAVDQMIEGAAQILTTLATQPEFKERDRERLNSLLTKVLPFHPAFTTIIVSSNDGVVLGIAQAPWAQSVHIIDRWYSRDMMQERPIPVSGRLIGYMTDEPSVAIAVPLKNDEGQRTGVLVAGISLRQLQQSLEEVARQEGTGVIVVDADGVAIAYPESSYVSGRTSLMSLPPVQHVLSGEEGTIEYRDPSTKESWLASYQPIKNADWGVIVASPASSIYVSLQESTLGGMIWLVGAIMLGTALAGFYSQRIAEPIRALTAHAMALATSRGLLTQKFEGDEVEQLGSALSCLSDSLSENMQELTRLRNEVQDQGIRLQGALTVAAQAKEQERKRLALDVHDGLAQLVAGALFEAQASEKAFRSNPRSAMKKLQTAEKLLAQAISGIDCVIYNLRPPELEAGELLAAIHKCLTVTEDFFGICGRLESSGVPLILPADVESGIYHIAQEAIHNSRKHSGASEICVAVEFGGEMVRVSIRDNGSGFDQDEASRQAGRHLGLIGMRERAESVGGTLTIGSALDAGTVVVVEVPVATPNPFSLHEKPSQIGAV